MLYPISLPIKGFPRTTVSYQTFVIPFVRNASPVIEYVRDAAVKNHILLSTFGIKHNIQLANMVIAR